MTASPLPPARCELADLLSLFSPGQVIGFYQGTQWIDWSESSPGLEILSSDRPQGLWRINRNRFHLVVEPSGAPAPIGAFVECLAGISRGVALVSSRLGTLLHWTSRIVSPPLYPQRTSGPFRSRTSGAVLMFRETTLRVVDRNQVLESATLSISIADPARAAGILEPSFPGLQVDRSSLHLSLRGHHAEEVLGRLRQEGIAVAASAVWYRLLQPCPIKPLRD